MSDAVARYDAASRQRWVAEPPKRPGRTAFERDRARVLHSAALRRLAGKTQVVGPSDAASDFPRTRLTHSLECAQIGRELGAALGCDPDLVEAACLAHDLGHPPFGHNGEAALNRVAEQCGGFEGNAQSFRILTRLEAKTASSSGRSAGLNLTRAVLDAATKYPWPRRAGAVKYGVYADDVDAFAWVREGASGERRCVEAQVMDWADDVAYSVHDLEDGVQAGHIELPALADALERDELAAQALREYVGGEAAGVDLAELRVVLDDLLSLPWWPKSHDGTLPALAALKNLTSQLIGRLCEAAEAGTREVHGRQPLNRHGADLVVPRFARLECALLKSVTARHVMARAGAAARQSDQREVLAALVSALAQRAPDGLEPAHATAWVAAADDAGRLRAVVDQVAALTDTSALAWWRRLQSGEPPRRPASDPPRR